MTAYLLGNLIFIAAWLALFILKPATRKLQFLGSFLLLPFALTDIWFRQGYWQPPLLIKSIEPLSLETAIYCFTAGGIAIIAGNFFVKSDLNFKINWLKVGLFLVISFTLYFLFEFRTTVSSMNALNYAFLIIWLVLLALDFKNYKGIFPAFIFAVFTIMAINLANIFYPNFVSEYWNLSRLWPTFLGTPTEEIFFAGALAALWTILPKYVAKKN